MRNVPFHKISNVQNIWKSQIYKLTMRRIAIRDALWACKMQKAISLTMQPQKETFLACGLVIFVKHSFVFFFFFLKITPVLNYPLWQLPASSSSQERQRSISLDPYRSPSQCSTAMNPRPQMLSQPGFSTRQLVRSNPHLVRKPEVQHVWTVVFCLLWSLDAWWGLLRNTLYYAF